jgi:DNA-binding PadR family transcriptional regulator
VASLRPITMSGMPGRGGVALSPGDWAVLGAVAEQPTHGFAVAQLLAPGGALGRIWSMPRPLVYQALKKLMAGGYIAPGRSERSDRGPRRTIVAVTPVGRGAVDDWLSLPVEHVRDLRSMLLLKLALLDRSGADSSTLVGAQLDQLEKLEETLVDQLAETDGFDRVLVTWRLESTRGATRFLRALAPLETKERRP